MNGLEIPRRQDENIKTVFLPLDFPLAIRCSPTYQKSQCLRRASASGVVIRECVVEMGHSFTAPGPIHPKQ